MYPKKLTIIDHLDELRNRILICLVSVFVFAIAGYVLFDTILTLLISPAKNTIAEFYFFAPQEAFLVRLKVAFFSGIIVSIPVIFYHVWMFVIPGLIKKERRVLLPMSFFAAVLAFSGILFCYFIVLPLSFDFLLSFGAETLEPMISIDTYVQFVTTLLAVFGVLFLLPIVVYLLSKFKIISTKDLASKRGYVLIVIFITAAVLTPPDIITQIAFALPMWALFELSVLIVPLCHRK